MTVVLTMRVAGDLPHGVLLYVDPGSGYVLAMAGAWLSAMLAALGAVGLALLAWVRRRLLSGGGLVILCLVLLGVGLLRWRQVVPEFRGDRPGVVALAFDGLDPRRIRALMARGDLPHIRAIAERGTMRDLATTQPPQSPVAWSSFTTGNWPARHGVFDFIRRDPRTHELSLALTRFEHGCAVPPFAGEPIWTVAARADVPLVMLALPMGFPPPSGGRILAGMGVPDLAGTNGMYTVFSSTPLVGDLAGGHIVSIGAGLPVRLDIPGPLAKDGVPVKATVHLEQGVEGALVLRWDSGAIPVTVGVWSEWLNLNWTLGWRQVSGGLRLLVSAVDPDLRIIAEPAQIDPIDPTMPIAEPPAYSAQLARAVGPYATLGMPHSTWALEHGLINRDQFLEQAKRLFSERERQLRYELSRYSGGLLFAHFNEPDVLQHMFSPTRPNDLQILDEGYRRIDELVGAVDAAVAPTSAIVVLSDHGVTEFRRAVHLNAWLREHGYLRTLGSSAGVDEATDVDWDTTRAWAVGFSGIYLNLRGREPRGIVTDAEAAVLRRRIADELLAWRDTDGTNVVSRVMDVDSSGQGDVPDMVVGYNVGYRASWQTALGAVPKALLEDNDRLWSGDHIVDAAHVPGAWISSFPLDASAVSIVDAGLTLLCLAGVPSDDLAALDVDGHLLVSKTRCPAP